MKRSDLNYFVKILIKIRRSTKVFAEYQLHSYSCWPASAVVAVAVLLDCHLHCCQQQLTYFELVTDNPFLVIYFSCQMKTQTRRVFCWFFCCCILVNVLKSSNLVVSTLYRPLLCSSTHTENSVLSQYLSYWWFLFEMMVLILVWCHYIVTVQIIGHFHFHRAAD